MTTPVDQTPLGQEDLLLAPTGELVLFIAGGILTLMVVGFVTWLMWNAFREEQIARDADLPEEREDS